MIYTVSGTLGTDMKAIITKFLDGVRYAGKQHDLLKSYGTADVIFGTVSSLCHVFSEYTSNFMFHFKCRRYVVLTTYISSIERFKMIISRFVVFQLDMDAQKLEENFAAIINDINSVKPHRPGPFITR